MPSTVKQTSAFPKCDIYISQKSIQYRSYFTKRLRCLRLFFSSYGVWNKNYDVINVTCFTSSERSGYFFIKRLNFSVCNSCSWIKEWKVMTLWSMVGQNKDSELHISSTISVIHNFRICFDFHFVMDCKNDYNFNYLWITLSFPRFFSHSFDSFIYYKQKNQAN